MNAFFWPEGTALVHKPYSSTYIIHITKKQKSGAGDMAQQLRALVTLPEDLVLISSMHVVAYICNSSSRGLDSSLASMDTKHPHGTQTYTQTMYIQQISRL